MERPRFWGSFFVDASKLLSQVWMKDVSGPCTGMDVSIRRHSQLLHPSKVFGLSP